MSDSVDLGPATTSVAALLDGVSDQMLNHPTPCEQFSVGDLLDHIAGLALAFTGAARHQEAGSGAPQRPHATHLPDDWRTLLPARLGALAAAWARPEAMEGTTTAGGVTLPAQVHRLVALQEVTVHGWDLAMATGQAYHPDEASVEALHAFLEQAREEQPDSPVGLFGPVLDVPDTASSLDRVLGLTGRDPAWAESR